MFKFLPEIYCRILGKNMDLNIPFLRRVALIMSCDDASQLHQTGMAFNLFWFGHQISIRMIHPNKFMSKWNRFHSSVKMTEIPECIICHNVLLSSKISPNKGLFTVSIQMDELVAGHGSRHPLRRYSWIHRE